MFRPPGTPEVPGGFLTVGGMSAAWMIRFGAVCGALLGLSLGVPGAVEAFTGETAATSFIIGLGASLGAPALTGLYLRHHVRAGRFGAFAYALNLIGLGLFACVAFSLNIVVFFLDEPVTKHLLAGPTRFALLGSAVIFVAGTVAFGVSLLRARAYPRLAATLYIVTLPLIALLAPLPDNVAISALHVLACTALLWLSWVAWARPLVTAEP
jgi:hypothetical protein